MKKSELDEIITKAVAKALATPSNPKPTLVFANKAGKAITSEDFKASKAAERTSELQAAIKAAMGGKPAAIKPTIEDVRKAGGNSVLAFIRAQRANGSKS